MDINVYCPSCRAVLRVPVSAAGKVARCPTCQAKFQVPVQQEDPGLEETVSSWIEQDVEDMQDEFDQMLQEQSERERVRKIDQEKEKERRAQDKMEKALQQREIMETALGFQRQLEAEADAASEGGAAGESGQVKVGVNRFVTADAVQPEILRLDPAVRDRQVVKLEKLRAGRQGKAVSDSLERIQQVAAGEENLVSHILTAVKSEATLGEISDAMRAVWGEHRENVVV